MERIALLVQKRLGDALFHTPALRWLRGRFPDARIEVLAPSPLAVEVFANNPHCDRVVDASDPSRIEHVRYDVVVGVFRNELSQAIVEQVTDDARLRERPDESVHRARAILEHVATAFGEAFPEDADLHYDFYPDEADRRQARTLLSDEPEDGWRLGIHVGCHGMAKRNLLLPGRSPHAKVWPWRTYRRLIRRLHARWPEARVVLTGSGSEAHYARRLRGPGVLDLAGQTSVGAVAAVIDQCDAYLTPDTGSLHLACTTDTPVLALFGPTDPAVNGPWPGHSRSQVLQSDSVAGIRPEQVLDVLADSPFRGARS